MKLEEFFLTILLYIILVLMLIGVIALLNFYDDYKCSITTDPQYWKDHNCIRYCKECKR